MGLLAAEPGETDYSHALVVADCLAEDWNESVAGKWGIELRVNEAPLKACCDIGSKLFTDNCFPIQPGPFKRTAAFVVLGRLYPFFKMIGPQAPQDDRERQAWLARFMALAIPAVLRQTKVLLTGKWEVLDQWRGFPSPHYKLEFLGWLRWLDHFERYKPKFTELEWSRFATERLARMVMSTSLMIETCYYLSTHTIMRNSIQSQVGGCLANLDDEQTIDLIYDYKEATPPPSKR